jgi:hypothetical protein
MSISSVQIFIFFFSTIVYSKSIVNSNINTDLPICNMLDDSLAYADGSWLAPAPSAPPWRECRGVQGRSHMDFQLHLNCHRRKADPPAQRWQPLTCRLAPFDAVEFFRSIDSHQLAIVGDSVSTQHYINLQCALEAADVLEPVEKHYNRAVPRRSSDNDALNAFHPLTEVIWHHTSFLYELQNGRLNYSSPERWFKYGNGAKHILVVNTGAWFNAFKIAALNVTQVGRLHADDWFRETVLHLVNNTLARFRGVLIFRSISPAHEDCGGATTSRDFQWDTFHQRNEFVRHVVRGRERMYYLDVEQLSQQRADGHPGAVGVSADCFHWCNPGPTSVINTWTEVLFNMLLQLKATGVIAS